MKFYGIALAFTSIIGCKTLPSETTIFSGVKSSYDFVIQIVNQNNIYCSANLIETDTLLTSLHCLSNLKDGGLWLPEHRGIRSKRVFYSKTVTEQQFARHYLGGGDLMNVASEVTKYVQNDFAIVKLNHSIPVKSLVKIKTLTKNTHDFFSVGYGPTKIRSIRRGKIVWDENKIQNSAPSSILGVDQDVIFAHRGKSTPHAGLSLKGDSGGGLFRKSKNEHLIYGIMSVSTVEHEHLLGRKNVYGYSLFTSLYTPAFKSALARSQQQ